MTFALVNAPAPIEDSGRFVETILDNLRASGVDNRTRGERLRFETLDPYPGRFLQAMGTFREGETDRRVAVRASRWNRSGSLLRKRTVDLQSALEATDLGYIGAAHGGPGSMSRSPAGGREAR